MSIQQTLENLMIGSRRTTKFSLVIHQVVLRQGDFDDWLLWADISVFSSACACENEIADAFKSLDFFAIGERVFASIVISFKFLDFFVCLFFPISSAIFSAAQKSIDGRIR